MNPQNFKAKCYVDKLNSLISHIKCVFHILREMGACKEKNTRITHVCFIRQGL